MFVTAVKKLESSLLKLYLVTAFVAGKQDKITDFFVKLAPELHAQPDWKEWFCKRKKQKTYLNSIAMKIFLFLFSVFPFCKNPDEHPVFAVCFTKQWQDTLLVSLHNFLATIFQCMPQPALTRLETEATLIKKLQEENLLLRQRIQSLDNPQYSQQATSSTSPMNASSHQSRRSTFHERKSADGRQRIHVNPNPQSLNDIIPFDIPPPTHIVDDFYIIAQETLNISNLADSQARSLRSIIRNISSGGSPVMGRKESADRGKKRSGSVGSRSWNLH